MAQTNNRTGKERNAEDHRIQSTGSAPRPPPEKERVFGGPGTAGAGSHQTMQEHDLTKRASDERRGGPPTTSAKGGATTTGGVPGAQTPTTMKGNTNPLGRNEDRNPMRGVAGAPPEDEVRRRAYELYEKRGRQPGHDQEDWFQAERDVKQRARTSK